MTSLCREVAGHMCMSYVLSLSTHALQSPSCNCANGIHGIALPMCFSHGTTRNSTPNCDDCAIFHCTCHKFVATTADHCNKPLRMKHRLLISLLQVITISGRTIRKEAQASPKYAEAAISAIEKLLAACPQQDRDQAQNMRKSRVNVKAV